MRNNIARSGGVDTRLGGLSALLGAVVAKVSRDLVHARVAAVREVAITGCLIAIRSGLVAVGRGLVAVRPRLVSIRERLVAISERLIVLRLPRCRMDALLLSLDRPVRRILRTID